MKKKQVIRRKSNVIPKYEIGGVTYGEDISKELLKLKLADENKSALGYGIDYGMQGMSAGSGFGGIGGTTGSLIMEGVGLVGGLLDGIINGKKDAEASNREQRKGVIDTMQANMYSGSTSVNNPLGQTVKYPYGGMMQPNAEVEGGEVLKQPNGQVNTMQGPSHAQGGIDVNAPQGTKVYSDRIKHKVGNKYETYAETAAKLNKILDKYKKVDKNEDTLKKNSDALMIARIQQKLDNLFDEQEMQKTAQGIEQPEQQTMAYGGTTGWPPYKEYNPYTMNPSGIDIPTEEESQEDLNSRARFINPVKQVDIEEETDNIELSTYNNDLNFNIPKNKIYFTGRNANLPNNISLNTAYNTGIMPTTTNKGFTPKYPGITGNYGKFMMFPNNKGLNFDPNNPLNYNPQPGQSFNANAETEQTQAAAPTVYNNNSAGIGQTGAGVGDAGAIETEEQKKERRKEEKQKRRKEEEQSKRKSAGAGILEAAPMIYNLLQKRPDQMPTAPYMDTQMVTPERMSNEQDLREAERNYSAIVNDKSLPVAQRLLASRQLQSTKAQILQQTENQYKQDINRAQEVNTAKIHKNIDTAMKIKDINDANIGAYANKRAQAMGDISQLAQKKTLEKNMAKKNDMMMNTLKSTFPDYTFKDDGTIVNKEGKPLSAEELTKVKTLYNALMNYNGQGLYNNPNVDPAYMNSYQAWDYSYGSPENTNYNKATGKE